MNRLESMRKRLSEAGNSLTEDQKAEILRIQHRLQAIDDKVKEYRESPELAGTPLYWYLKASGFTNDEIWIYSPHLGGEVGVDEPDWV